MSFTRDTIRQDNICLIWIDDMIDIFTWRDAFGVTIQTPNIDRLMAEGIRFAGDAGRPSGQVRDEGDVVARELERVGREPARGLDLFGRALQRGVLFTVDPFGAREEGEGAAVAVGLSCAKH